MVTEALNREAEMSIFPSALFHHQFQVINYSFDTKFQVASDYDQGGFNLLNLLRNTKKYVTLAPFFTDKIHSTEQL